MGADTPETVYELQIESYGVPLQETGDITPGIWERARYLEGIDPDTFKIREYGSLAVMGYVPGDQELYDIYHWVRGTQHRPSPTQ